MKRAICSTLTVCIFIPVAILILCALIIESLNDPPYQTR